MRENGFSLPVIVVGLGVLILVGGIWWSFSPTKPSTSGITFKKVSQDKLLFTGGFADPTLARLSERWSKLERA